MSMIRYANHDRPGHSVTRRAAVAPLDPNAPYENPSDGTGG